MDRISALQEALLDPKRTRISQMSRVSGRIFPDLFVSRSVHAFPFVQKMRSLRDACEKRVGQDRQHPVHQMGHHLLVSPKKDHAATEFVLEPGKESLRLSPSLVPTGPVGLHRDLLPSPGFWTMTGTSSSPFASIRREAAS